MSAVSISGVDEVMTCLTNEVPFHSAGRYEFTVRPIKIHQDVSHQS